MLPDAEQPGPIAVSSTADDDPRAQAKEQAALRRVASLVAHSASLASIFAAVAAEASTLLGGIDVAMVRHDDADTGVVVAVSHSPVPVGQRIPVGIGVGVAAPVVVEGRVWGTLSILGALGPSSPGTQEHLAPFAELAASAIANARSTAGLRASRARVVASADDVRRRLQRDIHATAQQRLVHVTIALKLARRAADSGDDPRGLLDEALRHAERAAADLRDIVRAILPPALRHGGLGPGLEALVTDVTLPVELHASVPRLPVGVETTAYFVVAEALANVLEHASATHAVVEARLDGATLLVEACDGILTITSLPGDGTTVHAELPVLPAPPAY